MRGVAIITARGGSKRIPRKNIKNFLGRPIIAYSIAAALESGCFDAVMVSTDDAEIAEVAESLGAVVPFRRSSEASNDFATTTEVLTEVLEQFRLRGEEFDYACCIYPTAPFINAEKLKSACRLLLTTGAGSVMPVVRFGFPIQRALSIEDGRVKQIWPEYAAARSQDLPPAYHDCGQFYFFRVEPFLETGVLVGRDTVPIELPESEVQDIDTEQDWKIAELKYEILAIGLQQRPEKSPAA